MVIFKLDQVPEMTRGRGVRLQRYKEQGLADVATFKGADGCDVDGFLIKPSGWEAGKSYPMVLNIHGGPNGMYAARLGQEREVVLVSFATASPAFAAQMADFLFQPQRLNVAVTRPRTKLILVGSHYMLSADQYDPSQTEIMDMLRDLINNCLHLTVPGGNLNE